ETMKVKAWEEQSGYEKVDAAWREWERVTASTRRTALAADQELRRRHPEQVREPVRSAEPASTLERARATAVPEARQQPLPGMPEPEKEPEIVTPRREDAQLRTDLGLTPETVTDPVPEHVQRSADTARETEEILARLRSTPEPGAEEDDLSPGEAWATAAGRQRDSVLQPAATLV